MRDKYNPAIVLEEPYNSCADFGRQVLTLLGITDTGSVLVSLLRNGTVLVERKKTNGDDEYCVKTES